MGRKKIKVGILGFGNLGRYLYESIGSNPQLRDWSVAFVWNRTPEILDKHKIPDNIRLADIHNIDHLTNFLKENKIDLVIEAAHPIVVQKLVKPITEHAHFFVTSLTAFADPAFHFDHTVAADEGKLIIPSGAGWGFHDIYKMGLMNTLHSVHIEMTFHPNALRLEGSHSENLGKYQSSPLKKRHLVAEGSIREIGNIAPNNANTMVGLALRSNVRDSLDRFTGKLWADKSTHEHIVEIRVTGPDGFHVETRRKNPAKPGAVTGNMTFGSFLADLIIWGNSYKMDDL